MPARTTRRAGKFSQLDHEILSAIFQNQVLGNSGEYEQLLQNWETKRAEAIAAQEEVERMRKAAEAALAEREAALEARIRRLEAIIAETQFATSDAALDAAVEERENA